MNKCNPDIRQGRGLEVKLNRNATETAFVVYDKGQAMHLTNAESEAVSSSGRELFLNWKGKFYLKQNKW